MRLNRMLAFPHCGVGIIRRTRMKNGLDLVLNFLLATFLGTIAERLRGIIRPLLCSGSMTVYDALHTGWWPGHDDVINVRHGTRVLGKELDSRCMGQLGSGRPVASAASTSAPGRALTSSV
ncbi:hypothetical protein MRX96_048724 [Rhipicephalus microplus]